MNALLEAAEGFAADLVALRRDLHRHPELSFREYRTADVAARAVEALGFRVRRNVGVTGVVAEIGSGTPVVALRADMDALPIQETGESEYRSTVPGVMHACGHDAHVTMLVGAARLLADAQREGRLKGTVRLLFQPSEEDCDAEHKSGAVRMIEDGAMQGVSAVFGIHIGAHMPAGKAFVRAGPYMAGSDTFRIAVEGRSAHAARPQEGIDAIVLASHAILAAQNAVARRISPMAAGVLTIGSISGGVAENVIAGNVSLAGTVRYFDESVRKTLHGELRRAFSVVDTLGGTSRIALVEGYPPVINDEAMTELARKAVVETLGIDALAPYEPWMGAEDFAYLAREAPGCFFWLGAALDPPREHHTPDFDIDESVLPKGAACLAACALMALDNIG